MVVLDNVLLVAAKLSDALVGVSMKIDPVKLLELNSNEVSRRWRSSVEKDSVDEMESS